MTAGALTFRTHCRSPNPEQAGVCVGPALQRSWISTRPRPNSSKTV